MQYRFIAFDLDGTALHSDRTMSERLKSACQRAAARGAICAISSGRIYRSTKRFSDFLGVDAPVINCVPRKTVEPGKYFHKSIVVTGNRFIMAEQAQTLAAFDNVQHAAFEDNTVQTKGGLEPKVTVHHVEHIDLQNGVERIDK